MKRIVQVVGRDGSRYDVALTAEEADFFLKLAELEARSDPTITFHDVVVAWRERRRREQADARAQEN